MLCLLSDLLPTTLIHSHTFPTRLFFTSQANSYVRTPPPPVYFVLSYQNTLSSNTILAVLLFSFRLKCHISRETFLNYTMQRNPKIYILTLLYLHCLYSPKAILIHLFPVFLPQFNISSMIAGYCLFDLFTILSSEAKIVLGSQYVLNNTEKQKMQYLLIFSFIKWEMICDYYEDEIHL